MNTSRNIKGYVSTQTFALIVLAGILLTCAFKILPAFLDNRFVEAALRAVVEGDIPINKRSIRKIKSDLSKTLTINNIRGDALEAIEVVREKDKIYININYEVRNNLVRNIDVVMKFENQLDTSQPELCCDPAK